MDGTLRSGHPTEPVAVNGPDAAWYCQNHENDRTPYDKNSPFYKLTEKEGTILYVGVTLANAGTSLHLMEDAVPDFKFPVYANEEFEMRVVNKGSEKTIKLKVHNPEQSKKRRCDELLPLFERDGVTRKERIGNAPTWVFDAKLMLEWMIKEYETKGVTMYTPHGSH